MTYPYWEQSQKIKRFHRSLLISDLKIYSASPAANASEPSDSDGSPDTGRGSTTQNQNKKKARSTFFAQQRGCRSCFAEEKTRECTTVLDRVSDASKAREAPRYEAKKNGIPTGIRTLVAGMKTRCPRPLDDRDAVLSSDSVICLCY